MNVCLMSSIDNYFKVANVKNNRRVFYVRFIDLLAFYNAEYTYLFTAPEYNCMVLKFLFSCK